MSGVTINKIVSENHPLYILKDIVLPKFSFLIKVIHLPSWANEGFYLYESFRFS